MARTRTLGFESRVELPMDPDYERLSLTEVIQLQNRLSEMVKRRFERMMALAFTDVVGSTQYFARFGDEAGRRLQQRHLDALRTCLQPYGGRIVDTAGDGAFSCYPTAEAAANTLVELQSRILTANVREPSEHQLSVRAGIHWGVVLSDEAVVTGDAVNLCARVAGTAEGGEVRLTRAAFLELPNAIRSRCRFLRRTELKGIGAPVELLHLEWRDPKLFPTMVRIEETNEQFPLPNRDTITFGRLGEVNGMPGNDVVLLHPDRGLAQKVSRWHFELRRHPNGFVLRSVSAKGTQVDGVNVAEGQEVPVRPGSVVRVAGVLTLTFQVDAGLATVGGTMDGMTATIGEMPAVPPPRVK
jgi:class 3 adenylate cyclase